VIPSVAKVIFISELDGCAWKEVRDSEMLFLGLLGILGRFGEPSATDFEIVQVTVGPAHDDLGHVVQTVKRVIAGEQKASPDFRRYAVKGYTEFVRCPLTCRHKRRLDCGIWPLLVRWMRGHMSVIAR
jgi:hypothetical protein